MSETQHTEWAKPYGGLALTFGVIVPAITVLIELFTHMCAEVFFDPLPNWFMTFLVASVPIANLHFWFVSRAETGVSNWILRLYGATFLISLVYALIMLPLFPIAIIGIIYFGIGLLPMAPIFTTIFMWAGIRRLSEVRSNIWKNFFTGMAIGLALLVAADLPSSATRLAIDMASKGDDRNAATLMRWVGSEDDLINLAHGATGRAGGLSSIFLTGNWGFDVWGDGMRNETVTARQLYFRTTGHAYNRADKAGVRDDNRDRWFWDADQGGDIVGGHVDTLSLASSRIDGSISAGNNVAYNEWTVEIANSDSVGGEARFTIVLPEGGVASRATLWVNGEPREASIAGRAEVKAAYKKIVQRQRDPLLVTTSGSGRLLVQAFPVPANGLMKFRVGFSAPLSVADDGARSIAMPAIVEQNFRIADNLKHNIWIEGDIPARQKGWTTSATKDGVTRLRASVSDEQLRLTRPRISAAKLAAPLIMTANIGSDKKGPSIGVRQHISKQPPKTLDGFTILLDGSVTNKNAAMSLSGALVGIAPKTQVGLIIAAEDPIIVDRAPWSEVQKTKFAKAISDADFTGGIDNIPMLVDALDASGTSSEEAILWIHGPQPVEFPSSKSALEQSLERSGAVAPKLLRYQAMPGRAFTIQGAELFETAREIPPSGNIATDLQALLSDISSTEPDWQISRSRSNESGPGSLHIVRLWAADELATAGSDSGEDREQAIDLAHRLNIITPISGAVVLETDKNYDENGLPVPSSDEVPSVPEPHEWALILMLILFVGWTLRRRGYSFDQIFHKPLASS